MLVVGEDAGSKLTKARELGITEWSESDLLREIERAHANCSIGSYQYFRDRRVGANIVIRSTDAEDLASCADTLSEALGEVGVDFTPGGI